MDAQPNPAKKKAHLWASSFACVFWLLGSRCRLHVQERAAAFTMLVMIVLFGIRGCSGRRAL
jgi:hypothetical protein